MKKVKLNSINKKQNGLEQSKYEKSSTLPSIVGITDQLISCSVPLVQKKLHSISRMEKSSES